VVQNQKFQASVGFDAELFLFIILAENKIFDNIADSFKPSF